MYGIVSTILIGLYTILLFAGGMALQRNPEAAVAMVDAGWEVASHGYAHCF